MDLINITRFDSGRPLPGFFVSDLVGLVALVAVFLLLSSGLSLARTKLLRKRRRKGIAETVMVSGDDDDDSAGDFEPELVDPVTDSNQEHQNDVHVRWTKR